MSRQIIDQICAELAGTTPSNVAEGDLDSWKVGGKMFACFGERLDGFSVKTDSVETAQMLIDTGAGKKAPYFHGSWILIPLDGDRDELEHRITTSYTIIFKSLTKKVRDALT